MKKMTREQSARKAAYAKWAKYSKEERSQIMKKISSLGGKARWKNKEKI